MRRRPVFRMLAGGLILVLMLTLISTVRSGGQAPRDIALAGMLPDGPLRIAAFGTSLTALPQIWPDLLAEELAACRGAAVSVTRLAGVGMGSAWALAQVKDVAEARPDLILVEFAINDADLLDGVSLTAARTQHHDLLAALHRDLPEAQILLLTMSPAQGPRGWIRPFLAHHYAQYHDVALAAGAALVDLHARWLSLPRAERGLERDGLHPDPDIAAGIIVPVILAHLGCKQGSAPG